jgi:hypothetical protein
MVAKEEKEHMLAVKQLIIWNTIHFCQTMVHGDGQSVKGWPRSAPAPHLGLFSMAAHTFPGLSLWAREQGPVSAVAVYLCHCRCISRAHAQCSSLHQDCSLVFQSLSTVINGSCIPETDFPSRRKTDTRYMKRHNDLQYFWKTSLH